MELTTFFHTRRLSKFGLRRPTGFRGSPVEPAVLSIWLHSFRPKLSMTQVPSGRRPPGIAAYYPAWSHDGKYVYFSSAAEGEPVFYRVQIKDHRLERVASLKEVKRATHGGPGSCTGLALDDSSLALRDTTHFEFYDPDSQLHHRNG